MAFPAAKLSDAVDLSERLFGIFPLLCYPSALAAVERRENPASSRFLYSIGFFRGSVLAAGTYFK